MSPKTRPKSFGTFEKQAPDVTMWTTPPLGMEKIFVHLFKTATVEFLFKKRFQLSYHYHFSNWVREVKRSVSIE